MTPVEIIEDHQRQGTYTLNTGGDCIISISLTKDGKVKVWDNFTRKKPVIVGIFYGCFKYYGMYFTIEEFIK